MAKNKEKWWKENDFKQNRPNEMAPEESKTENNVFLSQSKPKISCIKRNPPQRAVFYKNKAIVPPQTKKINEIKVNRTEEHPNILLTEK